LDYTISMIIAVPFILAVLGQASALPRTIQPHFSPKVAPSIPQHDEKLQEILKTHKESLKRPSVRHDFPTVRNYFDFNFIFA